MSLTNSKMSSMRTTVLTIDARAASTHVCPGHTCPYVTKNADQTYVCQLSGVCFGQVASYASNKRRLDQNGCVIGRHSSGPERVRRRRSHVGESQAAMLAAATLADEVGYGDASIDQSQPIQQSDQSIQSIQSQSSSASNFNESRFADRSVRVSTKHLSKFSSKAMKTTSNGSSNMHIESHNASKINNVRDSKSNDSLATSIAQRPSIKDDSKSKMTEIVTLSKMAADILDSLTGASRRPDLCRLPIAANAASSSAASITSIVTSCSQPETLFQEHGRKFMMRQTLDDHPPDLNNLHDIAINVRALITRQDERQEAHSHARSQNQRYRRIREAAARVATTLWLVLLGSEYMNNSRRTGDSFRPFASSVFMAMRSGIRLESGAELVPVCKLIGDALPEVRSQHRERQSHANHLSAHRGACTLHNSLASIPMDVADQVFAPVIEASAQLRKLCRD